MKYVALPLLMFSLLANCVSYTAAQEKAAAAPAPYFFIQAADPQLFYKQKDDRYGKRTVALAKQLQPDFMIVCGDLFQARIRNINRGCVNLEAPTAGDDWLIAAGQYV